MVKSQVSIWEIREVCIAGVGAFTGSVKRGGSKGRWSGVASPGILNEGEHKGRCSHEEASSSSLEVNCRKEQDRIGASSDSLGVSGRIA